MRRRRFVTLAGAAGIALAAPAGSHAQSDAGTATPAAEEATVTETGRSGYAPVNGLELYYEIHGGTPPSSGDSSPWQGEAREGAGLGGESPLVLLHGGLMTIDLIGPLLSELAKSRQVIAVELEGHGHTPLMDRPLTYEQMADDVAGLIEHLDLGQPDVFGYSLGGGVAWQLAIRHPDLVRKLVAASAPVRGDGWAPEIREAMAGLNAEAAAAMVETPMYQAYVEVAPNPHDWPKLVASVGQLASGAAQDYDWSAEVQAIEAPTLVIVGDADSVLPEQTVELFRLLGGGVIGDLGPLPNAQLAILPGTAHSALLDRADLLIPIVVPFLDAPLSEA